MPTDKEILYSMIDREIDNIMRINPLLGTFSSTAKRYVHNFLDPYLNFFMEGEEIQVDMAGAFVENEMQKKLENFKKDFIKMKEGND